MMPIALARALQPDAGQAALDPILPLPVLVIAGVVLGGFALWRLLAERGRVRFAWTLRLIMVLLVVVIGARPVLPASGTGSVASGGLEVYLAVDTTSSMAAEDAPDVVGTGSAPATRLDGAKADIAGILEALPGAQFSLTTFDGSSVQRVPLTSDATALASAADAMTQEVTAYSNGSSIDEPVQFLTDLLATARQEEPDRRRVLFYLGDGEQTRAGEPGSFEALAPFLSGGVVIGYGTDDGGRMRVYDGFDEQDTGLVPDDGQARYITDPATGQDALSRIDEQNLETIADQLGVGYEPSADGDVAAAVAGIDVGDVMVQEGRLSGPVEFYWIFAIPLGLLAIRELIAAEAAILATKRRDRVAHPRARSPEEVRP